MSPYSIQRVVNKQINAVKPANSWDEHLENSYLLTCKLPDSIRTHGCSRIKYIVFLYSEQFIANATPCFAEAVQFSFGLLCMVRGFACS